MKVIFDAHIKFRLVFFKHFSSVFFSPLTTQSGAYHTLELKLKSKFCLEKDEWDSVALEQLKTATDPSFSAEVAAVLLDDDGNALVCLVTSALSIVRATVDCNVPRKSHSLGSGRDQAMEKFFVQIALNIERHVNLQGICLVLIISILLYLTDNIIYTVLA